MRHATIRSLTLFALGGVAFSPALAGCSSGSNAVVELDAGADGEGGKTTHEEAGKTAPDASKKDGGHDGAASEAGHEAGGEPAKSCSDGKFDGDETDVDCGGAVCDALGDTCAEGKHCNVDADCKAPDSCNPATSKCQPSACHDGKKDGTETDVDCGGATCDQAGNTCPLGQTCAVDADCTSGGCDAKTLTCVATSCSDGKKDGTETDQDCGGPTCDALGQTCAVGQGCSVNEDCPKNDGCDQLTNKCAANLCSDGIQDGDETGVDCGGPTCDALGDLCGSGVACTTTADCSNGGGCDVTSHQCDATKCNDGEQDGDETGVDCGGATCDGAGHTCPAATACTSNSDCLSGSCCNDVCSLTLCPVPYAATAGQVNVIDSVATTVTGTAGTTSVVLTAPGQFLVGQTLFLQQVQGPTAGDWELAIITELAENQATLSAPLAHSYSNTAPASAQAIVVPQFTTVDVPATATLTAPTWSQSTGGVLIFQATGAVTIEGHVTMNGAGFRGYSHAGTCLAGLACGGTAINGFAGESVAGPALQSVVLSDNDGAPSSNGGGGGTAGNACAAGGGGAYAGGATKGTDGSDLSCSTSSTHGGGDPGAVYGAADLAASLVFGGAGGEGGPDDTGAYPGPGGNGGGAILILAPTSVTVTGSVTALGAAGEAGVATAGACGSACSVTAGGGGGGGGAGGSIRIVSGTANLGTNLVQATGGAGGACSCLSGFPGGSGGNGRVQVTSANVSGTTNPAAAN